MQRCLSKFRPLLNNIYTSIQSPRTLNPFLSPSPLRAALNYAQFQSFPFNYNNTSQLLQTSLPLKPNPFSLNQCRYISKSKEKRLKKMTPATSKLKKYKIKPYSSFKQRFRTLNNGTIRRWHAGKSHNAHSKSKISKRRLRLPALVHPAYAKVMKKLNFSG
ncbi:hypothetical protein ACHQM5_007803 [Ranunculus cassubicifolius]